MRQYVAILIVLTVLAAPAVAPGGGGAVPENIILFIGDGMGVSHVTAARVANGCLNMERLGVGGLIATHPAKGFVTDSAASGTAMATGEKTVNGLVSLSPEGAVLKTVAEYAEENGMATGVVVTCSVTHATPAAFLAHQWSRDDHPEIAEQIAESGVDVLVGGGWSYFVPVSREGSMRSDERDLLAELEERMPVVRTVGDFRKLGEVDAFSALLAPDHPPAVGERVYTLAELAQKAIETLARNEGRFFLMIEGSQIDWEAHDNDTDGIIAEMLDFDAAVGVGVDFAEENGRTLVIVTADHETGGFALHEGSIESRTVTKGGFASGSHTAAMVPIFASGPGSGAFGGIHENTFIGRRLIAYVTE
jgi:alkaline phosphatase